MNLNLLVGKTLGLGKKKFYPISSVFIGSGKNILSYPQLTAYYLSNLNKTEPFFISTMTQSFLHPGGFFV